MPTLPSPNPSYQVGGSLPFNASTYVRREADEVLFQGLLRGEFCYVFNSRQMGKSSLRVQTTHRLQAEGVRCSTMDMTLVGTREVTPEQWYASIVGLLAKTLKLDMNLRTWWRDRTHLSFVNRVSDFFDTVMLPQISAPIVIFIDEIDSVLSLKFSTDDFFALIRACYNRRAEHPEYHRLTFALFGVATPGDLIADTTRTPFNIGKAIELRGFQLTEATPLMAGLTLVIPDANSSLQRILHWTGGQPFLTQKLCLLLVHQCAELKPTTQDFIDSFVQTHILRNWESQDEPEHLKTIRDRLLYSEQQVGRLLGIYQQILQGVEIAADECREQSELLLSGLVCKQAGLLQVKNRIYQQVFNAEWVEKQLSALRPYSQAFDAWTNSHKTDESRLLRGQALKDAQLWALGKSLSDVDYQFLAASQECDRKEVQLALEAARAQFAEARLIGEEKTAKLQRFLLVAVAMGMLISSGLGMGTFVQYRQTLKSERQARISEVEALVSSADGLFASHRRLDALIEAIKAKQKLLLLKEADTKTEHQVENVLRQAVYEADEYNRLSGHQAAVMAVDISPDSQLIASASVDKTVKLWRRDGTEIATLKGHQAIVRAVKFSPDGQLIASAGGDGTVKLWRLDGTLVRTFRGHTAAVWKVAFSPDGQIIASGSGDNTVKVWTVDGKLLRTFRGHTAAVWGVAFSPDGQIIASGSGDNTVKLWKLDGTELTTLRGHSATIRGVAYSRDGTFVATVSEDNTLMMWNVQRILNLDLLTYGCDRVRSYLQTNRSVENSDRHLCDRLGN